ncbi:DUF2097 domain-containing protein [uncultured Methanobrevibacter sp.]|uniref:DUF2097 domain-containing protein n=1 Tax=uncultured Methanobrevibacter sp. TaxID=253161 RepID=UPI002628B242
MAKVIVLEPEEIIEYVRNNVKKNDVFELAYNRVFAPGIVLGITPEDEETGEGLRVGLQLTGEILSDYVEVDLHKVIDEILEIRHNPTGDKDDEENMIIVEARMFDSEE